MATKKNAVVFVLAITLSYCILIRCDVVEVNLGGTWIVTNANNSISVHGNVPGNVHTALYNNGTIRDPYFRFNDVKYRWIAYDNWTYTRSLEGLDMFFFSFIVLALYLTLCLFTFSVRSVSLSVMPLIRKKSKHQAD